MNNRVTLTYFKSFSLADQMMLIGTSQNRAENYFRLFKVMDSKGNILHLITNHFDLSAEEISEMYKSRWAIQNQVSIALIVYCLHVLTQIETKSKRKMQISRYL